MTDEGRGAAARPALVRIDRLPPGPVHAVGAAGLEVASMVRYLVEHGRDGIVLHDLAADDGAFRAAFEAAHKLQPAGDRARSWAALSRCGAVRSGSDHLRGIEEAVAVLAPVAWFLHPANTPLQALHERFVTWPDACFTLWRGPVVGVTGTVGKSSTTACVAALTGGLFCGNDRESVTDLTMLAAQPADRVLAFEVSNRHLHNGWRRRLDVGVLTGIALNHEADHGSFAAYRQAKYSMSGACQTFLYPAGLAQEWPDAADAVALGTSFGPGGAWRAGEGEVLLGPDGAAYPLPGLGLLDPLTRQNAVVAAAAAMLVGASPGDLAARVGDLGQALPAYRHAQRLIGGRVVVNDAAACVPASTAALVRGLTGPTVLICGGDRQLYREGEFADLARAIAESDAVVATITLGPMAGHLEDELAAAGAAAHRTAPDLAEAVRLALGHDATVVFSPGCGTGTMYPDKYVRGEEFDRVVEGLLGD